MRESNRRFGTFSPRSIGVRWILILLYEIPRPRRSSNFYVNHLANLKYWELKYNSSIHFHKFHNYYHSVVNFHDSLWTLHIFQSRNPPTLQTIRILAPAYLLLDQTQRDPSKRRSHDQLIWILIRGISRLRSIGSNEGPWKKTSSRTFFLITSD